MIATLVRSVASVAASIAAVAASILMTLRIALAAEGDAPGRKWSAGATMVSAAPGLAALV
jgi:hypothetical protein